MSDFQQSFQSRIARLKSEHSAIEAQRPQVAVNSIWRNLGYPLSFLTAFVLGAFAVMLARWMQFHMLGLPTLDISGNAQLAVDLGRGSVLATMLHLLFRHDSRQHMVFNMAGLWAAMMGMHNLVHGFPEVFNVIYAPEWVRHVIFTSDHGTLIFRGAVFVL
jgi:hypothetical protein